MGERVGRTSTRAPRIAVVYASNDPCLSRFVQALDRFAPVAAISFERAVELARLALGRYPHDPNRPSRLLVPSRTPRYWPRLHGPWVRRLTRGAPLVVLTRPDQAALLPWLTDRRIVYHAVDDYRAYRCFRVEDERAVAAAARVVFACSPALRARLVADLGLPSERVHVLPNAVPSRHLPPAFPSRAAGLPPGLESGRPLIGVIGAIDNRIRFDWVRRCAEALPWAHWLWVGRIATKAMTPAQRDDLAWLRTHPRSRFLGWRDYDALPGFAAALDAAVIPYQGVDAVPCGSPARLYLHLPFGAPIVASPDCPPLLEMQPQVRICDTADAMARALDDLRARDFDDGLRERRWQQGCAHTYEARAAQAYAVLQPLLEDEARP